ncbi:MAG: PD40 domain-containing protein [Chloroflexi bacterium]|nr:PD40 domain-containing protein [Chloroflexota bacterium]
MRRIVITLAVLLLSSLACTLTLDDVKPTPIPPTFTPPPSQTAVAQQASPTPSPSVQPSSTPRPTVTATPTLTPSLTPLPSSTPFQQVGLIYDQYGSLEVNSQLANGLTRPYLSFIYVDDQADRLPEGTPAPEVVMEVVYIVPPDGGNRIPVVELPATTENSIFWSPTGDYLAYLLRPGPGEDPTTGGLYILNVRLGITIRMFDLDTLQPRGIPGHQPVWKPDGTQLAITLPTAYETDIFLLAPDGSSFNNVTNSPAYDFWPAWSPDGRYLAFVSDRDTCPTWLPGQPNTCDRPDATPPTSGKLYLLDTQTGQVQKVNDIQLNSPPHWINDRYIVVTSGILDPLAGSSDIWVYDIEAGSSWQLTPNDDALYTGAAWNDDATQVLYQRAADVTSIVMADRVGTVTNSTDEYNFPRFGLTADWSPKGDYVAVGGHNGQCPFGLMVYTKDFQLVSSPSVSVLGCDPLYSPTGNYLAFTGISSAPGQDGRVDIYLSNPSGVGLRSVTSTLRGPVQMLGWVGPLPN